MEFQHAYSPSVRTSDLECPEPSLTQQQFKDDVDINVLLERYKVTGQLPQGVRLPSYGDFTGVSDYRSAMDAVRKASDSFMDLPAHVRARFDNDPQKFLEFVSDEKNRDEIIKLGLASPDAKPSQPAEGSGAEPQVNAS